MRARGEAARELLSGLWEEIDTAYARVRRDHPTALACRAGCADCCVAGLEIGAAEADLLRDWLSRLPSARREEIAARVTREEGVSCALLDDDAACSIYEARPLVCRAFGLPMRTYELDAAKRRLPIFGAPPVTARVVDTCNKNFIGIDLDRLDPHAIVDALGLAARSRGSSKDERTSLLAVIRAGLK